MEKTFSKIEISVIKSTAKNVMPFIAKKAKIDVQIAEVKEKVQKMLEDKLQKLEVEKAGYQSIIDSMNQAVKQITGGYTTEDLIIVSKEGTGQIGDNGKEIMKTVYNLRYPDTVIPPAELLEEEEREVEEALEEEEETEADDNHEVGEEPVDTSDDDPFNWN